MEAELAALAASGATTLVGLIVSESWERAKSGLGRFFRRSDGPADDGEEELRATRDALERARATGDVRGEERVHARLRQRLADIFQTEPGAAEELARLLAALAPDTSHTFVNLVSGGVNHGPVFQGSHIHGGITFTVQSTAPQPATGPTVRPDQVPAVTVRFSNRHAELATLDATPGTAPVSVDVLDGLPGVGKTAMAWQWAARARERFPDGQLYVDFAALRDQTTPLTGPGADVSEALAMCLRALPGGDLALPDSLAERASLFRSRTANLRLLLVLDDVNQPRQVRALIPKGPGSAVLATSQSRLAELAAHDGARLISVKPLDAHGGLELLRDRCGPDTVEAERAAAERLVDLCGGLPVALQVVAARLTTDDTLTMAELADELDDESGRLAGLALEGEESAVSTVLGPSYRLLPPDAARLYRLLGWLPFGVFDAGVAAVAAGTDTASARRLLGVLKKASLVEALRDRRFRMHDLVRLHARERAAEEEPPTEPTALARRVGGHYLALTAYADRALRRERLRTADLSDLLSDADDPFAAPGGPAPLEWLDAERPAILAILRMAVRHGLHTLAWQLAEAFTVLFLYHRYLGAWRESLELGIDAAAAAAATADTPGELAEATAGEARLRALLSRPLLDLGETHRAGEHLERAVALAETTDRLDLRASVQEFLGRYLDVVDPPRAVEAYRRSLALNEQAGETRGVALATFFLGSALDARGDHAEAMALLRRARSELEGRAEPDHRMAARVTAAIGVVHGHLGQMEDGIRELGDAVRVLGGVANGTAYEAQARERLADLAERAGGRTALVRECLGRAADIHEALGDEERARELRRRLDGLDGGA
ncbi:NB-ARC domain-containing protein [Streptomyces flavalbus]|uniref:NB-ARC domain-containing protein n=1 Tax=Streptomyces flavalbus TaxID=2665155 RepID=A0ABW2WHU9_9ACTN